MSVQDDSELEDSRGGGASVGGDPRSEADWDESRWLAGRVGRVRRGMLEGRRDWIVEEMLGGRGADKQQRPPALKEGGRGGKERRKREGEGRRAAGGEHRGPRKRATTI